MSFKTKFKSFFTVDDEYEYIEAPEQEQEFSKETKEPVVQNRKSAENVVNLTAISQSNSKVVLCEPRSYNEAQDIADHIMNRRAVVINLQLLDYDKSLRVIDFLSGTVYALNGDIQKLGDKTFLCTPDNIDVTGSISDIVHQEEQFNKGW